MAAERIHDVVVIGGSAGGPEATAEILAGLPAELPAAIFIAIHSHPSGSHLAPKLAARSPLPTAYATHGDRVQRGRVYVAPPDTHLVLRRGHVEVVRGPRENGHRPSIDVLFRSAAKAYGSSVIGVVLSGYLDCGTAGLLSIKARGGITVVQDPGDARVSEVPASSLAHVDVDHVLPLRRIPDVLAELVTSPAPEPPRLAEEILELEGDTPAMPTQLACPYCNGGLTETDVKGFQAFRCHVGHTFSLPMLARMHEEELERALWAAVHSLEDAANLSRRLASGELRERFADRARVQSRDAEVIRERLGGAPKAD